MTRQRRTSRILEKAQLRFCGLRAIDSNMDFGDTRNLQNMTQLMEQLRTKIDAYNTALAVIDCSRIEIQELEKTLGELMDKMLIGVAFKYGKDSREYEMAGGVRKSERVRKSTASRLKGGAEETSTEKGQTA
ncbi:hypothetical protein [Fischerella sp. JS2]|uniref:hypothetical protein n=1 Tax=Fischerella sp. JS2 TaxID=2597771 RepID=UPI0028EE10AB|nr:hypothetical protein [Fischerella sp. JS2]